MLPSRPEGVACIESDSDEDSTKFKLVMECQCQCRTDIWLTCELL